jgi:hypothetical protein
MAFENESPSVGTAMPKEASEATGDGTIEFIARLMPRRMVSAKTNLVACAFVR